jgi:hypothetical protein
MRVYFVSKDTLKIIPPDLAEAHQRGRRNPEVPMDFLEGGWDLDVLSKDGLEKMKEIVGDILAQAQYRGDGGGGGDARDEERVEALRVGGYGQCG